MHLAPQQPAPARASTSDRARSHEQRANPRNSLHCSALCARWQTGHVHLEIPIGPCDSHCLLAGPYKGVLAQPGMVLLKGSCEGDAVVNPAGRRGTWCDSNWACD